MEAGSISERAENGEGADADSDELFPLGEIEGGAKTIKNFIRQGADVKSTVSLAAAEVAAKSGLFDPEVEGKLIVTFEPGAVQIIPLKAEGKVQSYKVRQTLKPAFIERVDASTADIEASFELLLDGDASEAGKLLDKLKRRAQKVLATA